MTASRRINWREVIDGLKIELNNFASEGYKSLFERTTEPKLFTSEEQYTIGIQCNAIQNNLTLPSPNGPTPEFDISTSPNSVALQRGENATVLVTSNSTSDFKSTVHLSIKKGLSQYVSIESNKFTFLGSGTAISRIYCTHTRKCTY